MLSPHGSMIFPQGEWRRCCRAVLALHLAAAADESHAAKPAACAGGDGLEMAKSRCLMNSHG